MDQEQEDKLLTPEEVIPFLEGQRLIAARARVQAVDLLKTLKASGASKAYEEAQEAIVTSEKAIAAIDVRLAQARADRDFWASQSMARATVRATWVTAIATVVLAVVTGVQIWLTVLSR